MALLKNGATIVSNRLQSETDICLVPRSLLYRTLKPNTLSQDPEAVWQPWNVNEDFM